MASPIYLAKVKFPLTEKPVTEYSVENQKVYQDVFNIQNTLRLVLANFTEDAPLDGNKYVRKDNNWVPESLVDPGIPEAPVDNKEYARKNANWVLLPPAGIPEAPINGSIYGRKDAAWTLVPTSSGIPEAPSDGKLYGRKNASWVEADPDLPYVYYEQTSPKTSTITVNGMSGRIRLNNTDMAPNDIAVINVLNSFINVNDIVLLTPSNGPPVGGGGTTNLTRYNIWVGTAYTNDRFFIVVKNISAVPLAEYIHINFKIIKVPHS